MMDGVISNWNNKYIITLASMREEINTFWGICCCCSQYGYLKSIWATYKWQGKSEVYGKMLGQCFDLDLSPRDSEGQDEICVDCITKLREAYNFKKLLIDLENKINIKSEAAEDSSNCKEENCKEDELLEDYEDVEYLEEDGNEVTRNVTETPVDNDAYQLRKRKDRQKNRVITDVSKSGKKLKWPKKPPLSERGRTYRQYSDEQLVAAVESVSSGRATVSAAAQQYGVSRMVIADRVKTVEKDPEVLKRMTDGERFKFISEVKQMLRLTNMTPFMTRNYTVACLYCRETPHNVVDHTSEEHDSQRISEIHLVTRPARYHEILRVNTLDLQCTKCELPIADWNSMLSHLQRTHSLKLNYVYTHLIPFHLPNTCALCHQTFANFVILDYHMNSHYTNHICSVCGEKFITYYRLKNHYRNHGSKKFLCTHCKKVFKHKVALKKHLDMTHKLGTRFKCQYCDERFYSEYARHQHVMKEHEEKIVMINCEYCDKVFTLRQYHRRHVQRMHLKIERHSCTECGQRFTRMCDLKNHMMKHSGKLDFACTLCERKYTTKISLQMHLLYHKRKAMSK